MANQRARVQRMFLNKLARDISHGENTIETWPSDFYTSVKEAIDLIPNENVRTVMRCRCEGYTLDEIGSLLMVTRERIRQIEARGCNQLGRIDRYSQLRDVALYGKSKAEEIAKERQSHICGTSLLENLEYGRLSVRAYNVLCRGRCETVGDVVDAVKTGRVKWFRGMGQKVYAEVVNMLKDGGFLDSSWSADI